jgi:hypothetical protein
MWAWKGYVEPEGSRFGKGIVDYSPAWFMQAHTVRRIHLFTCLSKVEAKTLAIGMRSSCLS